ncbi:Plasma membrane ATPase 4 [Glycine soja]
MALIIVILIDGTIMTISKDRVKPSPFPDNWKLNEIFATGVVLGGYLALMTIIFFWAIKETTFFLKDYSKKDREAQWALSHKTLHGLQPPKISNIFNEKNSYKELIKSSYRELSEISKQAKRRVEVARLRELHKLKRHVEFVVKLKGLDIDTIQQHYTV